MEIRFQLHNRGALGRQHSSIFVDLIEKAHRFKHGNSGEKQATIVMIACLQMYLCR